MSPSSPGATLARSASAGSPSRAPKATSPSTPPALRYPAALAPTDVILLGVKAWQVPDAARAMGPLLGPDTFVVPLQNGVDAPAQLAAALGPDRVLGGLCRIIAGSPLPARSGTRAASPTSASASWPAA